MTLEGSAYFIWRIKGQYKFTNKEFALPRTLCSFSPVPAETGCGMRMGATDEIVKGLVGWSPRLPAPPCPGRDDAGPRPRAHGTATRVAGMASAGKSSPGSPNHMRHICAHHLTPEDTRGCRGWQGSACPTTPGPHVGS
jgi:hypothetical protein